MPAHKNGNNTTNIIPVDINQILKQKFVEAAARKCPEKSIQQLGEDYDFMRSMDQLFAGDNGGLVPPKSSLERYAAIRALHDEIAKEDKPKKKLPPAPGRTPRF